jgi:uncharacterized protein (TIGR03067 family)
VAFAAGVGASRAAPDGDTKSERVASLIRQLGHEEFEKREAASRELEAIGEPALDALRKARASDADPEIRRRAGGVIQVILARLGAQELARWGGDWEAEGKSWMKFTGNRWSAGTPTFGPLSGTVHVIEIRGQLVLTDLAVEEGPVKGQTCRAIFRLEGDTLHYCGTYTADRPTEFKSIGDCYAGVFKRVKK